MRFEGQLRLASLYLPPRCSQFADVIYSTPVTKQLTIENVGEVAAIWRFVPKPEEKVFGSVRGLPRAADPSCLSEMAAP